MLEFFQSLPLLTILIWLPFLGGVAVLCTGGDKNANVARSIAVGVTIISLLLCIPLCLGFDAARYDMQFSEDHLWISAYQIHYALGIDGISLLWWH